MSKIAEYLNEHIVGEVTGSTGVRRLLSEDGSVLRKIPDLVVLPRTTNDIRKTLRFGWQLAERGHVLPITLRGAGLNQTGAALGDGIIIDTISHLDQILHVAPRDKRPFVHVQPGVQLSTVNAALQWYGLRLPIDETYRKQTVGGALASGLGGALSEKYGSLGERVTRLEVVLANGDVIETGRLSKKELDKKKGLESFEGDIYRKIDGLIEDNRELIDKSVADNQGDSLGYEGIADVKQRDGSFDLTPLLIGSQGTLGVITEAILNTEFYSKEVAILVGLFNTAAEAHDAATLLQASDPASLELFDGRWFAAAKKAGKAYISADLDEKAGSPAYVLYVTYDDFSARAQAKKVRKATKILSKQHATIVSSADRPVADLEALHDVISVVSLTDEASVSHPPLVEGARVPVERVGELMKRISEIEQKDHVELPLYIRPLSGVVSARPALQLDRIGDKQKVFRIISDFLALVAELDGQPVAEGGEGRLKAYAAYNLIDTHVMALYSQIRAIFDPHGILNPGVKQPIELKELAHDLRSSYDEASNVAK